MRIVDRSGVFDPAASVEAVARQWGRGRPVKITEDLDRYELIIQTARPELVVETGTHQGYSAVWFAHHGLDVVTIDINSGSRRDDANDDRVTWLKGSSTDPVIVERVGAIAMGKRTMVTLDSDHSASHVIREIELYGPIVMPGCHLIVEDGICRWLTHDPHRKAGPLDAIEQALCGSPDWERDLDVESLHPVTMSPAGWWKRKEQRPDGC